MTTPIVWDSDSSRGYNVETARIGQFTATITCTGAGTIGANVFIGIFAGELVGVAATREHALAAIHRGAMRLLVEAGARLERAK